MVFLWWCQHPARELGLYGVSQDCGVVVVWWCFFPKQCGNTWGSYGNSKRPGCLDRGAGEVLDGIHRYFRGFVLACSFRL